MISDLKGDSKNVSVVAKVVEKREPREVNTRFGKKHVADVVIEDETGNIVLTLWEDEISKVKEGDTIKIENGYVTTWDGTMQLNVGKFGKIKVL